MDTAEDYSVCTAAQLRDFAALVRRRAQTAATPDQADADLAFASALDAEAAKLDARERGADA